MSKGSRQRTYGEKFEEAFDRIFKPVPDGWHIEFNPKPIPTRDDDWDFWHEDVDDGNGLCGTAPSRSDAIRQIEEWESNA